MKEVSTIKVYLDNLDELYEALSVDGNEKEALNDTYYELNELVGKENMLKIFKHYNGDTISCPAKLCRSNYVADLVQNEPDRQKKREIIHSSEYTPKTINELVRKRKVKK